jgi:hypothetical protein
MKIGVGVFFGIVAAASGVAAQTVPSDPEVTCSVPTSEFNGWFQAGHPTLNGVALPANSVGFAPSSNCSFYKWSEQMFLWLTSPAPAIYGQGGRIFDSAVFFDVSPQDATTGNRTFVPHTPGRIRLFNLRQAQVGPHRLPIILDRAGRVLEVQRPESATVKPTVIAADGKKVQIGSARIERGHIILLDGKGKVIEPRPMALPPRPPLPPAPPAPRALAARPVSVRQFRINNIPIFIDPSGTLVEVEQGQANGEVLESRNGSLIYYATLVNDVFAYFLTGAKDGQISPSSQFPTNQSSLNAVVTFAAAHSKTFVDPSALTVEVKTSWIDAATLPNASDYITITATVPTYDQSNPNNWVPNGSRSASLALVGMHVVGSVSGHPEMIWATFEHTGNAPDGPYSYINTLGQMISVPQSTAGTWLFTTTNSTGPFDVAHMQQPFLATNIASIPPATISPSDTIRWKAWGAGSDVTPNPLVGSPAASNSEIISVNNSVLGQLVTGDVRRNYVFHGATWTTGAAPSPTNQVGTSMLANTTMETYQQGVDSTKANGGSNCFTCHVTNTTAVSHVFPDLQPLF